LNGVGKAYMYGLDKTMPSVEVSLSVE